MNKVYILYCFFSLFCFACASSGSLGGGPKDKTPPMVIAENSSQNFQTNFASRSFELTFDEFVVLKDPIKQIVVSPPLTYIPIVKARGKKITFSFNEKEIIKDSTTYTVNFGEAIQDLHENNKLDNFRFVFSSGDIIDSLSVKGKVFDVLTGKPLPNITVMLYDKLDDSSFVKEKPFYFARTNKEGDYSIENIKKDTFRVFAIMDENVSYTYNPGTESMGYNDTLVLFSDSDTVFYSTIFLSKPAPDLRVFDNESKIPGKIKVSYNRPLDEMPYFNLLPDTLVHYATFSGDSLQIWYNPFDLESDSIDLDLGTDTLRFPVRHDTIIPSNFKILTQSRSSVIGNYDTIKIKLPNPSFITSDSLIAIIDTGGIKTFLPIYTKDQLAFTIDAGNIAPGAYRLRLEKGAFKDIYNNLSDSLVLPFTKPIADKLSNLEVVISGLDSTLNYIIDLQENGTSVHKSFSDSLSNIKLSYSGLRPGAYKIEITEDLNGNKRWDAVDFWNKRQAETSKSFTLENLRENWTIETEISFKE